jgi:hypothetical protein
MKPRSIASSADDMLVMAKGMQKGFIFLGPLLRSTSTAVEKVSKPPMALPIRQPHRDLSSLSSPPSPPGSPARMDESERPQRTSAHGNVVCERERESERMRGLL